MRNTEMLLKRCRKGDSNAMLEMSKCDNMKLANMWLVRAVLYGNEEAREILRLNPERASNTFLPIKNFIPGERMLWFSGAYSGAALTEIGFVDLPDLHGEYVLAGLSTERVVVLGIETGYDPPDEDGFGAETYYDYYVYDEFFNRVSNQRFSDNPYSAYGVGHEYMKTHKRLPNLRIDWLVEDGILNSDKLTIKSNIKNSEEGKIFQ